MTRYLLAAACLITLTACAAPRAAVSGDPDPAEVVEAWRDALVEERPRDAWALLAPGARQGMDEAAFLALYERQREALVEQAEALLRVARTRPPEERARVRVGEQVVEMVRTRDGWRVLRSAPVEPPEPEAPGEAQ